MKKNILLSRKFLFLLLFVVIVIFLISFNILGLKNLINEKYPNLLLAKELFSKKSIIKNIDNDYNIKFIPKTQFLELDFKKKKINFPQSDNLNALEENKIKYNWYKSFYLELLENSVLIVDYLGQIYKIKVKDIKNNKLKNLDVKKINSNLSAVKVLDTLIHEENLYVSFIGLKNSCKNLNIAVAKINSQKLNFHNFFSSNECGEYILGGRMQFYKHNSSDGLLLTTSNHPNNLPDDKPQSENSIFGKILFIDFKNNKSIIFSKGHRVPQGLYAKDNLILSTEHGPRGGDEINKILFNKNYGWPISSYGEKYRTKETNKPQYLKDHSKLGFEEPIFAFVPSVGISEIIKLPNDFSDHFIDNFIVSSLNGKSLHRIKFDENYNKVIFIEKIFIGYRIRDIKYHNKMNTFFLALEEKGELGILSR